MKIDACALGHPQAVSLDRGRIDNPAHDRQAAQAREQMDVHSIGNTGGTLAMANDETKTVLDDTSVSAVRLMLDKLADYDVAEV